MHEVVHLLAWGRTRTLHEAVHVHCMRPLTSLRIFLIFSYLNSIYTVLNFRQRNFFLGFKYKSCWQWHSYQRLRQTRWIWIFLLLISHGWVVTFPDSHRMVFTFRSWLDLLDAALAFCFPNLKISKLLQNCWLRTKYITSFEKHLESSLDHTLNFSRIWWYFVPRICG